jgi:hypothetical protein
MIAAMALAAEQNDTVKELRAEIRRLRAALAEIASDPTGVSYQADIAKRALA